MHVCTVDPCTNALVGRSYAVPRRDARMQRVSLLALDERRRYEGKGRLGKARKDA